MRTFHIFNINESIYALTKDDEYPLFHTFEQIKNLRSSDLSIGINLYEQVAMPIDKDKYNKKVYKYLKDSDFYTVFNNKHSYINKYRDENSLLKINNAYIKIVTNKEFPEFFKLLKKEKSLFACDFDNKDYFWLSNITRTLFQDDQK